MFTNNASAFFALVLVFASFTYFSSVRAESYYSPHDYVQVEIFQRLDGLTLLLSCEKRILSLFRHLGH